MKLPFLAMLCLAFCLAGCANHGKKQAAADTEPERTEQNNPPATNEFALAKVDQHLREVEADHWYVGKLDKQPIITMHLIVTRHADGTRTSRSEINMAIQRTLGTSSFRMETSQTSSFLEDAQGRIVSFSFDEEQDGQRTSAIGRVEGREVVATIHRLGRMLDQRLPIPDGVELLSDQASRDQLLKGGMQPGESCLFSGLELFGGSVVIARATTAFKGIEADGNLRFEMTLDMLPIPMQLVLEPDGDLASMTLSLGFSSIELVPSPGPVPLLGAEFSPTGLVTAAGPAPGPNMENTYLLPPETLAEFPEDAFQHVRDGVLRVRNEAEPAALADPEQFLKAEPQLEIDDPELRAWVAEVARGSRFSTPELAEQLRLAVRNHLTRDLTKGDGSALEAFRDKHGDCTEHANLLCACLRIAGIPARVEVGLVFAANYGGWCGHAWNSAYIDGRWVHLDSAYPGIERSLYIKLGGLSAEAVNTGSAMSAHLAKLFGKTIETLAPVTPEVIP